MQERGLTSRPSRKAEAKPLGANRLQNLLRNDYYIGIVRYCGKTYPGRHEPLISFSLFERVQTLLDSRRLSGERTRIHRHYLKGTLFCDECGGRLIFSRNRGRGGVYDYFVCRGKQVGTCSQPWHPVELVEDALVRRYAQIQLPHERIERIRGVITRRVSGLTELSDREIARAKRQLARLLDQEEKLLNKHYEDRISDALFDREQARLRKQRAAAERTIARLSEDYELAFANLDRALKLASNVQAAYEQSGPTIRRLLNQAFFDEVRIREDDIGGVVLAEPFRQLLDDRLVADLEAAEELPMPDWLQPGEEASVASWLIQEGENDRTPNLSLVGGSISDPMVELAGLEPATSWVRSRRSPN